MRRARSAGGGVGAVSRGEGVRPQQVVCGAATCWERGRIAHQPTSPLAPVKRWPCDMVTKRRRCRPDHRAPGGHCYRVQHVATTQDDRINTQGQGRDTFLHLSPIAFGEAACDGATRPVTGSWRDAGPHSCRRSRKAAAMADSSMATQITIGPARSDSATASVPADNGGHKVCICG